MSKGNPSADEALEDAGDIKSCRVSGLAGDYFTSGEALALSEARFSNRVKILNPFDNLVINRQRAKELFAFDYTLECYVPAPDRVFGYYGLPILWKNNLVGQMDVKANRTTKVLEVKNMQLLLRSVNEAFMDAWKAALTQFMAFQGVNDIDVRDHRSDLEDGLMGTLFQLE